MITLGQVLAHLNDVASRNDGFSQSARNGIEEIFAAIEELGGVADDYIDSCNDVCDDWVFLGDTQPRDRELVVVARDADQLCDGPDNGFVAHYVEDSGVDGWEVTDEDGQRVIRPGYADDKWKRI